MLNVNASDIKTGVFISIDGIQPKYIEEMARQNKLSEPKGLGWIFNNSVRALRAEPTVTTLTAASHTSNITCARPSVHGIYSNTFMRDGKIVSGYGDDIHAETLWESAKRQGRKVLSIAYVGADGRNEQRQATYGISYPDAAMVGKPLVLDLDITGMENATKWNFTAPQKILTTGVLKETTFSLVVNPKTSEAVDVKILLVQDSAKKTRLFFDTDRDLANGYLLQGNFPENSDNFLDIFVTENAETSPLKGYKRRAFVKLLNQSDNHLRIFISGASYNNAHPETFRTFLEEKNLVWPDTNLKALAAEKTITPVDYAVANGIIDRFLGQIASLSVHYLPVDLVLFYQPLIDTVGHSYESILPQPFSANAKDLISQAYQQAYQIVDRNLSTLISSLPEDTVVSLVGDHGMDPAIATINTAVLQQNLPPKTKLVSSGALALVYLEDKEQKSVDFQSFIEKTRSLHFKDKPATGDIIQPNVATEWQYGEAVMAVYAGSGFWYLSDPKSSEMFLPAPALGMHGHLASQDDMGTAFMLRAPGLEPKTITSMKLIDALPSFTKELGIDPPKNCEGHALNF